LPEIFEGRAKQRQSDAITENKSIETDTFSFLNEAIDEMIDANRKVIDYPSVLRVFESGRLEKIQTKRGRQSQITELNSSGIRRYNFSRL
jgi:vacuolar-type H+-ATPase subunit H